MAMAGYFFVYEAECQVYGLGFCVGCVGHCVAQVLEISGRAHIIKNVAAGMGYPAAAVSYQSAVDVCQDKVVRISFC